MIKVALDAMGGDNAPVEIVKGAIAAVNAVILNVLESLLNFIFISPLVVCPEEWQMWH